MYITERLFPSDNFVHCHHGRHRKARRRLSLDFSCLILLVLVVSGCDSAVQQRSSSERQRATPAQDQGTQAESIDTTVGPGRELLMALLKLLDGSENARGGDTWFSKTTANAIRSVSVDSTGHAIVDFDDLRPLIPNASSSAGSTMLLEELNSTVFSIAQVRSVEYRMAGSCKRFWEWLQYSCQTVRRPHLGM